MNLPPYVRLKHGRAYYVRKVAGKSRWKPLCRAEDGEAAIRAAYEAALEERPRTMADILTAWLKEPHGLRPRTQLEYRRHILKTLQPTFGKMLPEAIQETHIAQYMERRRGPTGNRERATLSTVFEWAMRKGYATRNPCRGVRRNKESPRRRYVEDSELEAALERAPVELGRLMRAAFLTGLRQGDLRAMRKDQVRPDGLVLAESKRGKQVAVGWSDELRALVREAMESSACDRVFTNSTGQPWSLWAVQSAMRRLAVDFTFHDLRAKAESDHAVGLGLLTSYKRARRVTPVR